MPDPGPLTDEEAEIVARIRRAARLGPEEGPTDARIVAGVRGFVAAFDFRYVRVIRAAVGKYRPLIVGRVNPLIRKMQLDGATALDLAGRLVDDWAARNFVTAGGFAIEDLAIGVGENVEKSSTEGIDLQEHTESAGVLDYDLYVLKSGPVTRNSDILKALQANSGKAEKLLRQNRSVRSVTTHYAIATGKTSSSFENGVSRPSSEEFWARITDLDEGRAVDLVLAMAAEGGRLVEQDTADLIEGLCRLVAAYIERPDEPGAVDWDWIAKRTMRSRTSWVAEDRERHRRALRVVEDARHGMDEVVSMAAEASEDEGSTALPEDPLTKA